MLITLTAIGLGSAMLALGMAFTATNMMLKTIAVEVRRNRNQ